MRRTQCGRFRALEAAVLRGAWLGGAPTADGGVALVGGNSRPVSTRNRWRIRRTTPRTWPGSSRRSASR